MRVKKRTKEYLIVIAVIAILAVFAIPAEMSITQTLYITNPSTGTAYVDSSHATTVMKLSAGSILKVEKRGVSTTENSATYETWALLKFEVKNVPSNGIITGLKIKTHILGASDGAPISAGHFDVGIMGSSWSEGGITWNNKPSSTFIAYTPNSPYGRSQPTFYLTSANNGYYTWDISYLSNQVQQKVSNPSADKSITFVIKPLDKNSEINLHSRLGGTTWQPTFEIRYTYTSYTMTIRTVDQNGAPISNALIVIPAYGVVVKTNTNGAYTANFPPQTYTLTATDPSNPSIEQSQTVNLDNDKTVTFVFDHTPPATPTPYNTPVPTPSEPLPTYFDPTPETPLPTLFNPTQTPSQQPTAPVQSDFPWQPTSTPIQSQPTPYHPANIAPGVSFEMWMLIGFAIIVTLIFVVLKKRRKI